MSKCIAITKRGTQCKNNKTHKLFCNTHIKCKINKVILEGANFGHEINYINEIEYFKALEVLTAQQDHKLNTLNDQNNQNDNNYDDYLIIKHHPCNSYSTNINTCKVCFDTVEEEDKKQLILCPGMPETHIVCKTCLMGNITSMLNDGIATTTCMFDKSDNCGGNYTDLDIKHAICGNDDIENIENNDMIIKWNDTLISSEIVKLAGICDDYLICPLCCKWGCIFEPPPGNGGKMAFNILCAKCGKEWCTLCKRKSHNYKSCYTLIFEINEDDDRKIQIIDTMLQDIVMRALTHCCTICGCTYIKEEGCNLMTCFKCNGMSCYICGMKLYYKNNTKYWHFTGHDLADPDAMCALWNNNAGDGKANQGNTEYNMKKVETEFITFINANKNNLQNSICKIIKKRIQTLFSKDKDYQKIIANIIYA